MVALKLDINHETFQVFPEYQLTFLLAVRMYYRELFIQGFTLKLDVKYLHVHVGTVMCFISFVSQTIPMHNEKT